MGKAARLLIDWLDAAHCLVLPLRRVAFVQLYKNHHQCGERQASLKAALVIRCVWKILCEYPKERQCLQVLKLTTIIKQLQLINVKLEMIKF